METNKTTVQEKEPIKAESAKSLPFAVLNYLNPYDYLHTKWSTNKNFDESMYQQALRNNEQDTYFALLEANKDSTLSDKFYDSSIADYETKMLELYKAQADNTAASIEKHIVSDVDEFGELIQKEVEMTEREWIQYQIDQSYEYNEYQLTRQMEEYRKASMSGMQKFWAVVGANVMELGEGILTGITGMLDFLYTISPAGLIHLGVKAGQEGTNFLDAYVDWYGKNSLTALEKEHVQKNLVEWERKYSYVRDIDGNMTTAGQWTAGIMNSYGMMIPSMILSFVTGGTSLAGTFAQGLISTGSFYMSVYSNNMYENAVNGSLRNEPSINLILNATVKTTAEVVVEKALDAIVGSSVLDNLLGRHSKGLINATSKSLGVGAAFAKIGKDAFKEGLEEFLQDGATHLIDTWFDACSENPTAYADEGFSFKTLLESFGAGALMSIIGAGGKVLVESGKSNIGTFAENPNYQAEYIIDEKTGQEVKNPNYQPKYIIDEKTGKKVKNKKYQGAKYTWQRHTNDFYYEKNGEMKRVKGFSRLVWGDFMSNLTETLKEVQSGKIVGQKAMDAIETAYKMSVTLGQYFASFDQGHLKAMGDLLSRTMKSTGGVGDLVETTTIIGAKERNQLAEREANKEYFAAYDKAIKEGKTEIEAKEIAEKAKPYNADFKTEAETETTERLIELTPEAYAKELSSQISEMVNFADIRLKYISSVKADIAKKARELQEAKVTEVVGVADKKKGTTRKPREKRELTLSDIEKQLGIGKVESKPDIARESKQDKVLQELIDKNGYEDIIIVDGHIALEVADGKALIVSEAWLENFNKTDIYKYLEQTKILETILESTELTQMLTKFYQQYAEWKGTTVKELDRKQALLDLLFNKSVFQSFLLSDNGKNAHDFKDWIFRLGSLVTMPSTNAERNQIVKQIYEQIQKTMREPMIKAILNWNMDMQAIGADSILTKADKEFIRAYQNKKKMALAATKSQRILDNIYSVRKKLREEAIKYIQNAKTDNERLQAYLLLEEYIIESDKTILYIPESAYDGSLDIDFIQKKADVYNKIQTDYGMPVQNLYRLTNESIRFLPNSRKLLQDMENMGALSPADFVTKLIEGALGDSYIVVEKSDLTPRDTKEISEIRTILNTIAQKVNKGGIALDNSLLDDLVQKLNDLGISTDNITKYRQYTDTFAPIWRTVVDEITKELDSHKVEIFPFEISKAIIREELTDIFSGKTEAENRDILINKLTVRNELGERENRSVRASEFVSAAAMKKYGLEFLKDYTVTLGNKNSTQGKIITINANQPNVVKTLFHEINHAIQIQYNLTKGGSEKAFLGDTADLKKIRDKVKKEYSYAFDVYQRKNPELNEEQILARMTYRLLEGEIIANQVLDNKINNEREKLYIDLKKVHGLKKTVENGNVFISFPDGTKYRVGVDSNIQNSIQEKFNSDKVYVENAFVQQLLNILENRDEGQRLTYHARLTRYSGTELVNAIMSPTASIFTRLSTTIDEIIKDPTTYLSSDLLSQLGDNLSEGRVYGFLKNWFSENFDGVNIDRDSRTHKYIFVDDNAFDDLYTAETKKNNNDGTDFLESHKDGQFTIGDFYSKEVLNRLGIPSEIIVDISTDGYTETIFDEDSPMGEIHINSSKISNNAKLLDVLNHEFRHVMQDYNYFETGFTIDFKVTPELLADVKKHVPELFTDEFIRKLLKTDERIVQYFVYYGNSGELEAYGISNRIITKPNYVTEEAGKPVIYLPWYDAKTGEGRHKTAFLAGRHVEDDFRKSGKVIVRDKTGKVKEVRETTKRGKKKKSKKTEVEIKEDNKLEKAPIALPLYEKKTKTIKIDTGKVDENGRIIYKYKKADATERHWNKEYSEGTNLEYFDGRKGLDPEVQNLVILSTGNEKLLPPELMNAIKRGVLTRQSLLQWFRTTDLKKMNQFTFDLMNECIFHNDYIKTAEDLDRIMQLDVRKYYGLMRALAKHGLQFESILKQNNLDYLMTMIEGLVNSSDWKDEIYKIAATFDTYITEGAEYIHKEDIAASDKTVNMLRVAMMNTFDGSLAGTFYAVKLYRRAVRLGYYEEKVGSIEQGARGIHTGSAAGGDTDEVSLADMLTDDNKIEGIKQDERTLYKDITALYEYEYSEKNMIKQLTLASEQIFEKRINNIAKKLKGLKGEEAKKLADNLVSIVMKMAKSIYSSENQVVLKKELQKLIMEVMTGKSADKLIKLYVEISKSWYEKQLSSMEYDDITMRYDALRMNQMFDIKDKNGNPLTIDFTDTITRSNTTNSQREAIQARIKSYGTQIGNLLVQGKIVWDNLPDDVKNMFNRTVTKGSKGSTISYSLKEEVYQVGRGKIKGGGSHDVSTIIENRDKLNEVLADGKAGIFRHEETAREAKQIGRRLEKKRNKAILENMAAIKTNKQDGKAYETEIVVEGRKKSKKQKKTSDTPNNFTIYSNTEMPDILKNLLDTSFADMADTLVQFASKDEAGNLYKKGDKEFESRLQHEVMNWDTFYEANRETLRNLTYNNVLDIIEFIQRGGVVTFEGPANKLAAFQLFLVGYIVDAARQNLFQWDLSNQQIEMIEELYEKLASFYGSGLNAVKQMIDVVNPVKKVKQQLIDEWYKKYNITEEQSKPLFDNLTKLGKATTQTERDDITRLITQQLKDIDTLMYNQELYQSGKKAGQTMKRGWGKRWYQKLKSARYTFMLSSPTTWVRNIVSNTVTTSLNITSDSLAKIVFAKKGYRKGQFDLSIKADPAIKEFVNTVFKKSNFFSILYDNSTKYSDRNKALKEKEVFASMVVNAIESKYAANHRFDNNAANFVTKIVNTMISDKPFIKFATNKYFAKMLTLEVQAGKINLEDGISDEMLNLFAEAVIMAQTEYMHKKSFAGEMIDKLRDNHPVIYEVLNWFQPFINSGLNWFAEGLKYTPVGLAKSIFNMVNLEKTITKIDERRARGEIVADSRVAEYLARRDIGKGIVGMVLLSTGLILGLCGFMRIDEDDDKIYMTLGDVKIDISSVFGTSSVLIGASLGQIGKAKPEKILGSIFDSLTEGLFLKDILEQNKYNDNMYEWLLSQSESVLKSFVPQFVQLMIRAFNKEKIKYSSGMKGMWERWLNSFVPTQPMGNRVINPYTGQNETKYALYFFGELLKSGIVGPKIVWHEIGNAEDLATSYDVNKGNIEPKVTANGKEYSLGDAYALNQYYGKLNTKRLSEIQKESHLVRTPDGSYKTIAWNQLSDEQKKNVIEKTFNQNATISKIYIWTQVQNKKYYANDSMYETLKKLGITKNVYRGDKGYEE